MTFQPRPGAINPIVCRCRKGEYTWAFGRCAVTGDYVAMRIKGRDTEYEGKDLSAYCGSKEFRNEDEMLKCIDWFMKKGGFSAHWPAKEQVEEKLIASGYNDIPF